MPVELNTSDLYCRNCGYLLRGLPAAGACPECGMSVEHSLRSNLLQYADAGWLMRLSVGSWIIFIGGAAWVAAALLARSGQPQSTAACGALFPATLNLLGYFQITTPEPDVAPMKGRALVRGFAVIYVCALSMRLILGMFVSPEVGQMLYLGTGYVCVGWSLVTVIYFQELARRLQTPKMTELLAYGWILPAALAVFLTARAMSMIANPSPARVFDLLSRALGVPLAGIWLLWWGVAFWFAVQLSKASSRRPPASPTQKS